MYLQTPCFTVGARQQSGRSGRTMEELDRHPPFDAAEADGCAR